MASPWPPTKPERWWGVFICSTISDVHINVLARIRAYLNGIKIVTRVATATIVADISSNYIFQCWMSAVPRCFWRTKFAGMCPPGKVMRAAGITPLLPEKSSGSWTMLIPGIPTSVCCTAATVTAQLTACVGRRPVCTYKTSCGFGKVHALSVGRHWRIQIPEAFKASAKRRRRGLLQ